MSASASPTGLVATLWRQKWLILATMVLTTAATVVWSYYFLPTRYRSEASIVVIPPRLPVGDYAAAALPTLETRLLALSQQILSRTRIERLAEEFQLASTESREEAPEDLVERVRRDVVISMTAGDADGIRGFRVGFVSSDPRTAQRVAERLAGMFVKENMQDAASFSDSGVNFVTSRIDELRKQVAASEQRLADQRKNGGRAAQADIIEYDVLQDTFRALLVRKQELEHARSMQRRFISEQLKVADAARLPAKPIGPDRTVVNVAGSFAGLTLGFVLAGVMSFRRRRTEATATSV
jgi:uncharacterized protein involved in exopolysaccharide biosynthesis